MPVAYRYRGYLETSVSVSIIMYFYTLLGGRSDGIRLHEGVYCTEWVCVHKLPGRRNLLPELVLGDAYVVATWLPQCDFRFGLFFRFNFRFRFASYFLVLVSFQFYSIGDFYKYVMMHITSHQHILDILHQHIGDCHT